MGEDAEKLGPCVLLMGVENGAAAAESSLTVSRKLKQELSQDLATPLLETQTCLVLLHFADILFLQTEGFVASLYQVSLPAPKRLVVAEGSDDGQHCLPIKYFLIEVRMLFC